jgi:hypothetical protein
MIRQLMLVGMFWQTATFANIHQPEFRSSRKNCWITYQSSAI